MALDFRRKNNPDYEDEVLMYGYVKVGSSVFHPYYTNECKVLNAIYWKSDKKITLMIKDY